MILQTFHWAASNMFWLALALVLTGLFKQNRGSAKLCANGRVQFSPSWWFVCAWVFILLQFGFIGNRFLRSGLNEPLQFLTGASMWIAAIGAVSTIPGILVVTDEALEEVNWVWRNKKLLWTEIQEIDTEKRGCAVTVIGAGQRRIVYWN